MRHVVLDQFWERYNKFPAAIRKLVDNNFSIIKQYPNHPLLRLLKVENIVSMRVGSRLRAIGCEHDDTLIWFWIGTHKQYKNLLN